MSYDKECHKLIFRLSIIYLSTQKVAYCNYKQLQDGNKLQE